MYKLNEKVGSHLSMSTCVIYYLDLIYLSLLSIENLMRLKNDD